MEYFILDEKNQQIGPLSIEQLASRKISDKTKVWCQNMKEWADADTVNDLKDLFISTPPPNNPPPAPQLSNNSANINSSNHTQTFNLSSVYEEYFNLKKLNPQEIDNFKKNRFFNKFSTALAILLHFITLGIFTTIYCGLKFSKLPKIKSDDFGADKAIGFLFIPFFNFYWIFVFWRGLASRINLQFRLRNEQPPVSVGLATAICILIFIPYLGGIVNYFILMPILFSQIQSASNRLAHENNEGKQ